MADDPLARYREKRRFEETPEPAGSTGPRAGAEPLFVIQKHAASSLHYDLRLEVDGVLKSWAVPKGPSPDPHVKRLAIAVEDHPLDYGDFEGVIPDGNYGAGAVIVWDIGPYRQLVRKNVRTMQEAITAGHVVVELAGHKLLGAYALTRTRRDRGREQWLLVKLGDEHADPEHDPTSTEPQSVLSKRTIEDLLGAES
jgi:DNA ligase D-like protein (predicted 3'-phosphoesterase)